MARTFGKSAGGGSGDGDGGSGDKDKEKKIEGASALPNGDQKTIEEYDPEEDTLPPLENSFDETEFQDIRAEAQEAQHLYLGFVRDEFHRRGLSEPPCLDTLKDEFDSTKVLDWTRAGRELRHLADVFSRSRERETVRRRAQAITLNSLDMEHFFALLQELFQGEGVTSERILILFFFCADLAIESLKSGYHKSFHTLMQWSLRYIVTRVARWVHDHGGWVAVLQKTLTVAYQLSACCAFIAVAVACVVYIKRSSQ